MSYATQHLLDTSLRMPLTPLPEVTELADESGAWQQWDMAVAISDSPARLEYWATAKSGTHIAGVYPCGRVEHVGVLWGVK